MAVQTGSSIGLIAYALLALFGAGLLLQDAIWQLVAGLSGMTVLFYLGLATIRDRRDPTLMTGGCSPGGATPRRALGTGAILSLANPLDMVFWLSIAGRVLHDPELDGPAFLSGVFVGCILSSLVVALFAGFWQSLFTSKAAQAISWTCGLTLIGFGLKLGHSLGRQLMIW